VTAQRSADDILSFDSASRDSSTLLACVFQFQFQNMRMAVVAVVAGWAGQAVVSVVLLAILHNQMLQTERLLHSFNVIFDDFKDKIKTYPPKLQGLLRITIDQVDKQGRTLTRTFRLLKGLSLLPIVGALLLAAIKYWDGFVWLLMTILSIVFSALNVAPNFLSP